ncbi:conserved hypothetical protein [Theileria equi strain WA]|uniref:Large ribosomal subunit protein mL49 n=1 Tax=Theileria equi strain WA TaxID=1537102 RepID=L1LDE1_THEEQ|nr:conserved hypothetical protein [Theileria equi strain WA]EKX73279.1 conserved hypothetical protein [Theileria equi strain WA]|eukprot:XP_004832731.1 conserved hypothetical protein [Theileria equi strain WA]
MRLTFRLFHSKLQAEIDAVLRRKINAIPFHINRTASDNLAVFVKHRNNNSLVFTHVRKVKGNRRILKEELKEIVGRAKIVDTKDCFVIQGNHKCKIRSYLKHIGF